MKTNLGLSPQGTIALAVAALFMSAGSAFAGKPSYVWVGGTSSNWTTASNWSPSAEYPGLDDSTDTALIDSGASAPVSYNPGNGAYTIASVTVDAEAANAAVGLTQSSGALDINGLVTIKGEQDSGGREATLTLTSGSFTPDTMQFFGGSVSSYGHAVAELAVDMTVQGDGGAGVDVTVLGFVDWDLDVGVDFDADYVSLSTAANLLVIGNGTGEGESTLKVSQFAPNDKPVEFRGGDGTLVVQIGT